MKIKKRSIFLGLALSITALVWGLSLSAQSQGMKYLSPNYFNAFSSILGGIALLPIAFFNGYKYRKNNDLAVPGSLKKLLIGGFICGCAMTCASLLQQWGLVYATAGKAGFLSSLYVAAVPIIGAIFKRKTSFTLWIAMFLSVAGTYLLCRPTGGASLNAGDICLLLAASFFAIHILLIDRYSYLDSIQFCCVQLFIAGFFSIIAALYCYDPLSISGLVGAALLLLYCGIVSIGMGYTVQIYAQKFLHPAACAIILSCEAFYAVLGGWLFLHEKLTLREFTGGSMIFIAIVLAQIFSSKSSNSKKENQSTQENKSLEETNTTN